MTTTSTALRHLPLLRHLTDAQLDELLARFEERPFAAGAVLFREGDKPTRLELLVEGEVELTEAGEPKLTLRAPAPLGELGALTGIARNTTAVAKTAGKVLACDGAAIVELFSRSSDLALAFHRTLLSLVAEKVQRDRARLGDMRANLVRTQKRMKELRELVLSSPETPLSQPLCEGLDDLIEHNRRAHYRVQPLADAPVTLRLDGKSAAVVELSDGYLKLAPATTLKPGQELSGVLSLPGGEIAVSGRVTRVGADGVVVALDLLIDDYQRALLGYVTQLQLVDFVV
ncbi:MAG TPA: cyclic nucleotide-binding domain-containing protein [Minicystis sp.]|nr:cyclic nucleotide-binding domain-containing protein [Minicystis sp.]